MPSDVLVSFQALKSFKTSWELDHLISTVPALCTGHKTKKLKGSVPLQQQAHLRKLKNRKERREKCQKKYSERRRGRSLRHFLVIVTQHFEENCSMADLVKSYISA